MKLVDRFRRDSDRPMSVVDTVQQETSEATRLARIADQDRLADPRTNPATRPIADRLRNERQRKKLKAAHTRELRGLRVAEKRAAHAEDALEALLEARDASSAAKSVLALNASRTRYMRLSLATSVVLAFGSAMGLEKIADTHPGIPSGSGYIAEVGLTGLATIVILARSDLTRHSGQLKGWQDAVMWTLMIAPLLASVVANIHSRNVIGAICAVGAAAFSLFSYVVADAFAVSAGKQAEKVSDTAEADLNAIASGQDPFAVTTSPRRWVICDRGRPLQARFIKPTRIAHQVATPEGVTTSGGHTPRTTPVGTDGHKPGDHTPSVPTVVLTDVATAGPTRETTRVSVPSTPETTSVPTEVVTTEPMAIRAEVATPATPAKSASGTTEKPRAKRRTRDEIRSELQVALKEHYDSGGGEPKVQPLAEKVGANRRIIRELLDEMNVRPMIRKAVGQ